MAKIKIEAARRLSAVRISKDSYTDSMGRSVMSSLQDAFDENADQCHRLHSVAGVDIYRYDATRGIHTGTNLLCVDGSTVVGSLHLTPKAIKLEGERTLVCVSSVFLSEKYRRQGIVSYLYKWALSKRSLLSDDRQSKMSHALWKKLGTVYEVQVVEKEGDGFVFVDKKWNDPKTRLFIKGPV